MYLLDNEIDLSIPATIEKASRLKFKGEASANVFCVQEAAENPAMKPGIVAVSRMVDCVTLDRDLWSIEDIGPIGEEGRARLLRVSLRIDALNKALAAAANAGKDCEKHRATHDLYHTIVGGGQVCVVFENLAGVQGTNADSLMIELGYDVTH